MAASRNLEAVGRKILVAVPWKTEEWVKRTCRVLRGKPVRLAISRKGNLSRKYIRRTLDNMLTVITPDYP